MGCVEENSGVSGSRIYLSCAFGTGALEGRPLYRPPSKIRAYVQSILGLEYFADRLAVYRGTD